jgi:hypothetical protein
VRRIKDETPTPVELAELMKLTGADSAEVAFRLGVTPTAVRKWLEGKSPMSGSSWWFLRADLAKDLFGVEQWPPASLDQVRAFARKKKRGR